LDAIVCRRIRKKKKKTRPTEKAQKVGTDRVTPAPLKHNKGAKNIT